MARRRYRLVLLALALAAGLGVWMARPRRVAIDRKIGRPVADFSLPDASSGRPVALHDYRGRKALVLVFMGTECPVGNLYMSRLVELEAAYRSKGVEFLIINSNAHETAADVAEHARTYRVGFPVLKDANNALADRLEIERTCETLVLDGRGRLCYRGAIDDQYEQGRRRTAPARPYLVEALDAVLAGRAVATATSPVIGCPLDRVEPLAAVGNRPRVRPAPPATLAVLKELEPEVTVGAVTYAADVAPILQEKCQSCHRPGQVGPFSLLTCTQARRWASAIREVLEDRRMPPWHADPRFGHFVNDRSLTPRQRATLLAWIDQGTPPGDSKDLPPAKAFTAGWTIGTPDVVLTMDEPFTVPAQGFVRYQHFRVRTGFAEDRWVHAAEARPGDRAVVHHIGVYVDDPKSKPVEQNQKQVVALYFPGENFPVYPPDTALRIPAGADLTFEVHYTPVGVTKADQSSVGIIFARGPVAHEVRTKGISDRTLRIPPGAPDYPVHSSFTFPTDSHLLTLMPHMHLRGKDFLYTAYYPDGRSEVLLSVPAYDFGWQSIYILSEPKAMPRGTRIDCVAHFDNSPENPANPNPKKAVIWGEQTWQEMMIGYIDYYEDPPTLEARRPRGSRLR
jgi:peroxiredoxin